MNGRTEIKRSGNGRTIRATKGQGIVEDPDSLHPGKN